MGRGRSLQKTSPITSLPSSKPFHGSPSPRIDRDPLASAYSSFCLIHWLHLRPRHPAGLPAPQLLLVPWDMVPAFPTASRLAVSPAPSISWPTCSGRVPNTPRLHRLPSPAFLDPRLLPPAFLDPRAFVMFQAVVSLVPQGRARGLLVPVEAQRPARNRNSSDTA